MRQRAAGSGAAASDSSPARRVPPPPTALAETVGEGPFWSHLLIRAEEVTLALSSSLKTKCFL